MSHLAIAAALARDDISAGERLVAFSLASFADRENRTRPGTAAAAGRAGLRKSRFLEARDRLVRRGLLVVEQPATGRGRASTLRLGFAHAGPWWDGEVNAELFETVLGYCRAQGSARLLLAAAAALADDHGVVEGVTTKQLCAASGLADRTYRRARTAVLASGELVLLRGTGGRGNTNCWQIPHLRSRGVAVEPGRRRRVTPPAGARPPVAAVTPPPPQRDIASGRALSDAAAGSADLAGARNGAQDRTQKGLDVTRISVVKGGQDRTLSALKGPDLTGVSAVKGGQDRTLFAETPAETPAKTPAPNARAGSEPRTPEPFTPPTPLKGGATIISSSRRPTSLSAVADADVWSRST